jgi:hypothetical protein
MPAITASTKRGRRSSRVTVTAGGGGGFGGSRSTFVRSPGRRLDPLLTPIWLASWLPRYGCVKLVTRSSESYV